MVYRSSVSRLMLLWHLPRWARRLSVMACVFLMMRSDMRKASPPSLFLSLWRSMSVRRRMGWSDVLFGEPPMADVRAPDGADSSGFSAAASIRDSATGWVSSRGRSP